MIRSWLYHLCAIALTAAAIYGGFGITRHVIVAVDKWGDSAPDLKPTLDAISGPRGTLHEVNKAVVKMGDAVVTTQLQERAIAPATIATLNSLATIAPHANLVLDNSKLTLDAATQTAQALTDTLGEGKRTIAALQPLEASLTRNSDDINAVIRDNAPSLHLTLQNAASMTSSGAGILADGKTVADKSTADYLKAHTKWGTVGARLWGGYDILSWAAEHRP